MANTKRLSQSITGSWSELMSPVPAATPSSEESDIWVKHWQDILARDLIDSRIVSVEAETSVEDACERLLSEDILCLVVKAQDNSPNESPYVGLFDFSDVNAFLTLAATRHTLLQEELRDSPRLEKIVTAARAGRVPVHLVSNLSDKNPLETLPHDANIISLLELFSRGTHRVLIQAPSPSGEVIGMVSDRGLLSWFSSYATQTPTLQAYLSNSLNSLFLPCINMYSSVVASHTNATVLDAMKLMSEEGVSSIAVLDEETSCLFSAVSVTDIGKVVVPSQSNQILSTSLSQFVSQIKAPDGSQDGADKYPVYSVFASSALSYTILKLLTTNAHRVFVTRDTAGSVSPVLSAGTPGNLSGIVSIVDILSIFARIAKIPNVDPTRMQRHRRASSSSSHSSKSDREIFLRSRSNSRTSIGRSQSLRTHPRSPGPGPGSVGSGGIVDK